MELARTRITGFPWDLLGVTQVDNIPLAHIATLTGVYGLSFEIMVVNTALAAAFVIRAERGQRSKRKPLLLATAAAVIVLQAGRLISPPPLPTDHTARLVQQNIPVLQGSRLDQGIFRGHASGLERHKLERSQSQPSSRVPRRYRPCVLI